MSDPDDQASNPSQAPSLEQLIERRFDRRELLRRAAGLAAVGLLQPLAGNASKAGNDGRAPAPVAGFEPVSWQQADHLGIPATHRQQVVLAWGDPILAGAPAFDPAAQTAAAQAGQFGYNADYVGFLPLPLGSQSSEHGLLCVSHEYTSGRMMHPDWQGQSTGEQMAIEQAAHGMSVVEIRRQQGLWQVQRDSRLNRRITATTPIRISGPAAGHAWLQTAADPTGRSVLGTLNNCAGGLTPWGTWLQAEENFNGYFTLQAARLPMDLRRSYDRLGIREQSYYGWEAHDQRFSCQHEAHEANRFGWIVEVDPYRPDLPPVKRTALGRFKHEAASVGRGASGRCVVYMGDDQQFEYVYKFVSAAPIRGDREADRDLLDQGVLFAARFDADGGGEWLPLVQGQGPLTAAGGFPDQATVLIRCREAADLLGATPMDRPEDIDVDPRQARACLALTNNSRRSAEQRDAANPRGPNLHGHLIEIRAGDEDHESSRFTWDIILLAGPHDAGGDYRGHADASPLSCPDNLGFAPSGELLVTTDGQISSVGANDGLYVVPLDGPKRGRAQQLLSGVPGGEVSGPEMTADGLTLFCAIQHPGSENPDRVCTYHDPGSRFPDYRADWPPRAAVVAISRADGGPVLG